MSLERSCKFYDHSRCLLSNQFCDLDCSRVSSGKEFGLGEAKDKINQWSNEELEKELRKNEWRWR